MNSPIDLVRAKLAPADLEIGSTNLSPGQMEGFHAGYELAAAGDLDLTQGTVDLLGQLLEAEDAADFRLGRLIGYLRYHEELLREMAGLTILDDKQVDLLLADALGALQ